MSHHEKTELAKVGAWLAACATISVACLLAGIIGAILIILVLVMIAMHVWVRHR